MASANFYNSVGVVDIDLSLSDCQEATNKFNDDNGQMFAYYFYGIALFRADMFNDSILNLNISYKYALASNNLPMQAKVQKIIGVIYLSMAIDKNDRSDLFYDYLQQAEEHARLSSYIFNKIDDQSECAVCESVRGRILYLSGDGINALAYLKSSDYRIRGYNHNLELENLILQARISIKERWLNTPRVCLLSIGVGSPKIFANYLALLALGNFGYNLINEKFVKNKSAFR